MPTGHDRQRLHRLTRSLITALAVATAACGGSGGGGSGGGGSGGGPSGSCTDIANVGSDIAKTTHAEPTPAMTGGTITDGTYVLTAMDKYNGHSGDNTHKETWKISGGKLEVVTIQSDKPEMRASGTYTTSSNMLTLNVECPYMGAVGPSGYTATATQIQIVNADDPNEVHTLTKQ